MNDDTAATAPSRKQTSLRPNSPNRELAAFLRTSIRNIQRWRAKGTLQARIDAVGNVVPLTAVVAPDKLRPRIWSRKKNVVGDVSVTPVNVIPVVSSPGKSSPGKSSPGKSSLTTAAVSPVTSLVVTPVVPPPTISRWKRFVIGLASSWLFKTSLVMGAVGYFNVWPKVDGILNHGLDSSNWGLVELQIFLLFLTTQIWLAIRQTYVQPWHWLWRGGLIVFLVVFGLVVVGINTSFAIDSVGLARDSVSDKNASTILKAAEWTEERDGKKGDWIDGKPLVGRGGKKGELYRKQIERSALPKFEPTSEPAIKTAEKAVADAKSATEASNSDCRVLFGSVAECNRLRRGITQANENLAKLQGYAATQKTAADLDAKITKLGEKIAELTDKIDNTKVPEHKDALASRIAGKTGWSEDQVADNLPIVWGGAAELSGLIGPLVLDLAFAWLVGALVGDRHG